MAYRSILLLGGSGFIGRHAAALLSAAGKRVIVPTRRESKAKFLRVLPTVELVEANIHDDAVLARLLAGADVVINLVGILHSRPAARGKAYGPDFEKAHVDLPRRVAAACAAQDVRRCLHMSALGAARDAPSMYLRSKADGEAAVFAHSSLACTVFRPSVVFGEEDRFLNLFADMQKWLPVIPLAGADARFQPIYVRDVAAAIISALDDPATAGKVLELVGPRIYTLRELVRLSGEFSGHPRPILPLPDWLAHVQAWFLEHLPGEPLMSRDNLDSMKVPNIGGKATVLPSGMKPAALEAIAPYYLAR
ncbi:MAG: complex subunit family protein [Paucimonas sp.]|nr:complex subunit family protein [Paucimonas sp.]